MSLRQYIAKFARIGREEGGGSQSHATLRQDRNPNSPPKQMKNCLWACYGSSVWGQTCPDFGGLKTGTMAISRTSNKFGHIRNKENFRGTHLFGRIVAFMTRRGVPNMDLFVLSAHGCNNAVRKGRGKGQDKIVGRAHPGMHEVV